MSSFAFNMRTNQCNLRKLYYFYRYIYDLDCWLVTGRYLRTETAETVATLWYRCNAPVSFNEECQDCPREC